MSIAELIILAIGLSMDSFAVSLGSGALMKRRIAERALKTAVFLASFQAAMPIIGWIAGEKFKSLIESWDHWIAFGVLLVLGGKMIADTFFTKNEKENKVCDCYDDIASTKNDVNRTDKADTTEEGKSVKTSCCPWKTRNLIGLSLATSIERTGGRRVVFDARYGHDRTYCNNIYRNIHFFRTRNNHWASFRTEHEPLGFAFRRGGTHRYRLQDTDRTLIIRIISCKLVKKRVKPHAFLLICSTTVPKYQGTSWKATQTSQDLWPL